MEGAVGMWFFFAQNANKKHLVSKLEEQQQMLQRAKCWGLASKILCKRFWVSRIEGRFYFRDFFTVHNTTQRSYGRIINFSLWVKW
jgi:hypothetical protein